MATSLPELTYERARTLLEGAEGARVLVVGDCMLDRYVTGDVERISPEAPVPVVRVETERRALGGAANVAHGVRGLGAECRLVGVVGDDAAGLALRDLLGEAGVGDEGLASDGSRPTTVKTRILARHQQMLRIDREEAEPLGAPVRKRLREEAAAALEWAEVLVLVDYDKGVLSGELVRPLLRAAAEREMASIVDPKLRNFYEFSGSFLFKPNGRELAAALGEERPPRDERALRAERERLGCRHLLVTLGEEGMVLVSDGEDGLLEIPSEAREVYDVSGAGDTVTAALGATLGAAPPVADAALLANFAAGLEVSRLGAVPITGEEILRALEGEAVPETGAPTQ